MKNSPYLVYLLKSNKNRVLHENKDHVTSKFSRRLQEENLLLLAEAARSKKRDLKFLIKNQNSNFCIPQFVESTKKCTYYLGSNSNSQNSSFLNNNESKEEAYKNSPEYKDYNNQSFENCKVYIKKEIEKNQENEANLKEYSDINILHQIDEICKKRFSENSKQQNLSENMKDSEDLNSERKEEKSKCPLGHSITLLDSNICKKCSKQFEKCKEYASEYNGKLLSQKMDQELEFCCSKGHRWIVKFSKK